MTDCPVLLLVDLQNDYLSAPGLEPHRDLVTSGAARLLAAARSARVPVVHVWTTIRKDAGRDDRMPHWKAAGTSWCVEHTEGHRPPAELAPQPDEHVVHKSFFSAFSSGSLDRVLAEFNPDVLVLAGVHLHACVRSTGLDGYQRGFRIWIAQDAIGTNDPLHGAITRRYLEDRSFRFATVDSISNRFRTGENPFDEDRRESRVIRMESPGRPGITWTVPVDGASKVSAAVKGARSACGAVRSMTVAERATAARRLSERLKETSESLVTTIVEQTGKPRKHGRQELAGAILMLDRIAARIEGEDPTTEPDSRFRRRPLGNVAVISSWNNPVYIPLGKIVPALCYGNTVVWKPAEAGTGAAGTVHELLMEAFPPASVQVTTGDGDTGRLLVNSPDIDGVSFTGSVGTGRLVQEACARRFVPLQAELGGNNAAVVLEDADVALAAGLIARGAFAQAGQRCTANRRAVVIRSILPSFIDGIRDACRNMLWGDPGNEAVDIGPLISRDHKSRVERAVGRAGDGGCDIEYPELGTESDAAFLGDTFFPPVIVVCEDSGMAIVQEELFGPVLVIQPADSFENAMSLCNGVRQGLAASIFTSSTVSASRFMEVAQAGILKINQATDGAEPDVPFGGWKASGAGPAEHGASDREFYTRVQAIYTNNTLD